MSDELDVASEQEEYFRSEALRVARIAEKTPADWEAPDCYDCGLVIPAGRLALGKWVCVECQTVRENANKLYRKN